MPISEHEPTPLRPEPRARLAARIRAYVARVTEAEEQDPLQVEWQPLLEEGRALVSDVAYLEFLAQLEADAAHELGDG